MLVFSRAKYYEQMKIYVKIEEKYMYTFKSRCEEVPECCLEDGAGNQSIGTGLY